MWLASVLEWAAAVCMALSVPLMLWQLGVGIMGLFSVRKLRKLEDKTYRFAVVSCARNEEAVIGQLLDSLQNQRYPRECFDLFVIADNCTDDTAAVARKHGAIVLEISARVTPCGGRLSGSSAAGATGTTPWCCLTRIIWRIRTSCSRPTRPSAPART